MENASQALTIAGSVLIGMLIIALVITGYNQLRDYQRYDETLYYKEQVAEFNNQFDVYIRDVYGSEMLSIVNKSENYNKLEVESEGYSRFDVIVTFKNDIGGFKKGKKYSTDEIISIINTLQSKIESYANKEYGGKKVSQLAVMRTNELNQFIKDKGLNKSPDRTSKIEEDIRKYTEVKADEVTIKSKMFKYITSSYDKQTGRIKQIEYKEM